MAIIKTRFGDMDAEGLKAFKSTFDAGTILHAVDRMETLRGDMKTVCNRLLRLHRMSQCLIKGIEIVGDNDDKADVIWEIAEQLAMSMQDWPDEIDAVRRTLAELEQLVPEPDNDDCPA